MPAVVIIGAQWGDEGKGSIVGTLAPNADITVRYNGGGNSGHRVGKDNYFNIVPSALIYPHVTCVIANGVVIDPAKLVDEIRRHRQSGLSTEQLFLSSKASVTMPYHYTLEALQELGYRHKIGTTRRGIGPTIQDGVGRYAALAVSDICDKDVLYERLIDIVPMINGQIRGQQQAIYEGRKDGRLEATSDEYLENALEPVGFVVDELVDENVANAQKLKDLLHITDTVPIIEDALDRDLNVLLEGAQGTMLDVNHGNKPYVTSSVTTAAGVSAAGLAPADIDYVLGVVKAYPTRVGNGPFPSEIHGETADKIRDFASERGTTTGRPRRIGWMDLAALRYAYRRNKFDGIAVTGLNVLPHVDELKVLGKDDRYMGMSQWEVLDAQKILRDGYEALPAEAMAYINLMRSVMNGVHVSAVALSFDPNETLVIENPFQHGRKVKH